MTTTDIDNGPIRPVEPVTQNPTSAQPTDTDPDCSTGCPEGGGSSPESSTGPEDASPECSTGCPEHAEHAEPECSTGCPEGSSDVPATAAK